MPSGNQRPFYESSYRVQEPAKRRIDCMAWEVAFKFRPRKSDPAGSFKRYRLLARLGSFSKWPTNTVDALHVEPVEEAKYR